MNASIHEVSQHARDIADGELLFIKRTARVQNECE